MLIDSIICLNLFRGIEFSVDDYENHIKLIFIYIHFIKKKLLYFGRLSLYFNSINTCMACNFKDFILHELSTVWSFVVIFNLIWCLHLIHIGNHKSFSSSTLD